MNSKQANKNIQRLINWLNFRSTHNSLKNEQLWDRDNLEMLKRLILMHGVGPYMYHLACELPSNSPLPEPLLKWLERLYEMNAQRIERIHSDLNIILRHANRNGIAIMPLKGVLLTSRYYHTPHIRPMADIDLLIKPGDYKDLHSILDTIGYQLIEIESVYSNHYKYLKPDNINVADPNTEHPDNPVPVEVHIELRRSFLGKSGDIDLSDIIWKDSSSTEILNQKVVVPTEKALLTYLASHATTHFLMQTGRIIHWIDLSMIINRIKKFDNPIHSDWVYIPIKLSQRAFPSEYKNIDFSGIEEHVDKRLIRWCDSVPLDGRCGLMTWVEYNRHKKFQLRMARWRPTTWRLILAFGHIPMTIAYLKYAKALLGRLPLLFRNENTQQL